MYALCASLVLVLPRLLGWLHGIFCAHHIGSTRCLATFLFLFFFLSSLLFAARLLSTPISLPVPMRRSTCWFDLASPTRSQPVAIWMEIRLTIAPPILDTTVGSIQQTACGVSVPPRLFKPLTVAWLEPALISMTAQKVVATSKESLQHLHGWFKVRLRR